MEIHFLLIQLPSKTGSNLQTTFLGPASKKDKGLFLKHGAQILQVKIAPPTVFQAIT
ncbi:hypothetical protein X474_05910 [Dethiosulfatarculus sandiegensis]|uniref:Uncharacterized protein n=1 Tax=Dethiosulfatarculus sandiegensis TaxID=1429043 RepID=A0A0D2GJY3_9BACT|nr:hypothetical protein X474_05910 [Dethiosulfatarculus sandiegensis]